MIDNKLLYYVLLVCMYVSFYMFSEQELLRAYHTAISTLPLVWASYYPINLFQSQWNFTTGRPFMNISAIWSTMFTYWIMTAPCATWSQKKWYLNPICFVQGIIFGAFASEMAPWSSSKTVEWVMACDMEIPKHSTTSRINTLVGRRLCMLWLSTIYSASMVDRATSVCNLLAHIKGQPTTYKNQDISCAWLHTYQLLIIFIMT